MTRAEEIANTVVFLLSPKSRHTTGQLIHVDNGYVSLDGAMRGTSKKETANSLHHPVAVVTVDWIGGERRRLERS
jgi:hypothetical protein